MEFEVVNVKTESYISCLRCKKTDGEFTLDALFKNFCNVCFMDEKEWLKMEWSTKMSNALLPCGVCLESYTEENRLVLHSCKRAGIESCERCGQQFYSRKSMRKHCKIVHNFVIDGRDCVVSSKDNFQFDKQSYIERFSHKSSLIIPPYKISKKPCCQICNMSFTHAGHLKRHVSCSHTDQKSYQCLICSKRFSTRFSLVTHSRSHTGEKPFQCSTCSKSFTTKASVARHSLSHTGEKPYKCFICNKNFRQKSSLNFHIGLHKGEKPFHCLTCGSSFSQKFSLDIHIRSHKV